MSNCLFCKIINKEIPADIFYEDDHAIAFFDIKPLTKGHSLVVPKYHAYGILELPDEEVAPVFLAVKKVAKQLSDKFGTKAFTIGINNGKISGQAVDHLHIHIIPRFAGDGGGSIHSIFNHD